MATPTLILAQQGAAVEAPQAPTAVPGTGDYSPEGVPLTLEAVLSMRQQRGELSDQLLSALGRRADLAEQIASAPGPQRPALEARLQQLDERILNIEREIARTGELIARAPGQYISQSERPNFAFTNVRPDITAISIVLTIFVLAPMAVAIARLVWKRASAPPVKEMDPQLAQRLKNLESGVDAIALEVERISEGQRFVTKLLADREKARLEAPRS